MITKKHDALYNTGTMKLSRSLQHIITHERNASDVPFLPIGFVQIGNGNLLAGAGGVYKLMFAHIYADMRIPVPGCFKKHQVPRQRLTEAYLFPHIVLPFHRPGKQNAIQLVHIHDIPGAVKSAGRRPALHVPDTQKSLCRSDDFGPVTCSVCPQAAAGAAIHTVI
jgi:hypothetical protein